MKSKMRLLYTSLTLMTLSCTALIFMFSTNNITKASTDSATMSVNVLEYLNFTITSNDSFAFDNLTPGTPDAKPDGGTVCSVTTNGTNGYTLSIHDGSATNSPLVNTDTTTYIADYAGTVATPTSWTGTGLGITLFAADTSKEAKWGTGTTYNDSNNKYAGIPLAATVAHTVTGYHAAVDTSSWAFKIDVPNSQKTGAYTGSMTFTATAVLS